MNHPDGILDTESVSIIRAESSSAEKSRQLSPAVLKLMIRKGWLRIMEPVSCGGIEWPLSQIVRFFEALAWADANVGWCVNLGAGANMFAGYLPEATAVELFRDGRTWCAGSGAVSGIAKQTAGGYRISGQWKYASGAAHATHFTGNCYLQDEQGAYLTENGKRRFLSFMVPATAVTRKDTWNVIGLKATSSDHFEMDNVFVPRQRMFSLLAPSAHASGPLFQFPFDVMAVLNMACMPTGIAFHFIELFEELAAVKTPLHGGQLLKAVPVVKDIFQRCQTEFLQAREEMYRRLAQVWQYYEQHRIAPEDALQELVQTARQAAHKARLLVYELFPLCGMTILYTDAPLNKVWRDMVTAGQHYLLSPLSES